MRTNRNLEDGIQAQADQGTKGMGANIIWPGLLRKLDRIDPTYKE